MNDNRRDLWVRRIIGDREGPGHIIEVGGTFPQRTVNMPAWTICRRTLLGKVETADYPDILPYWWNGCRDCMSLVGLPSGSVVGTV